HRLGQEIEDEQYIAAEVAFFDDVVSGVVAREEEIDALLAERLTRDWRLDRRDRTLLQILRAGGYELVARPDIPTGTTIGDDADVSDAMNAARIVDGVLDAVAKAVR